MSRFKLKAPMNSFKQVYKVPSVKTLDEPLEVPKTVRVQLSRSHSLGGSGWLSLGLEGAPIIHFNVGHEFSSPCEAVLKLAEFKSYLGAEVRFV